MSDIGTSFEQLHDTLAHMRLLLLLTDENVTLDDAQKQDLHIWLNNMAETAASQAIAAEVSMAKLMRKIATKQEASN